MALHQRGRLEEAQSIYLRVVELQPTHALALNMLGGLALQADQPAPAVDYFDKSLNVDPKNAVAYINRGTARSQLGSYAEAIASFDQALAIGSAGDAMAWYLRGTALAKLKQYGAAIESYDRAIAIGSQYDPEAYYERGLAQLELKDFTAALASFEQAIARKSEYLPEAFYGRGVAQLGLKLLEAAIDSLDRSIALQSDFDAQAYESRGIALFELHRLESAAESFERAIERNPRAASLYNSLGAVQSELGQLERALANLERAIELAPEHALAHRNRGIVLGKLQRFETAIDSFDCAVALNAGDAQAWASRGVCLAEIKRFDAAVASFTTATQYAHGAAAVNGLPGMLLAAKGRICDWRGLDAQLAELCGSVAAGIPATPPFNLLALTDEPHLHRLAAETWIARTAPATVALTPIPRRLAHNKIRVGYFSADFRDHATMYLMAGLFDAHDRERLEIVALSYGPDSDGPMRRRLKNSETQFIDVRAQSDQEIALLSRRLELDVAVDLNGFAHGGRPGIFACRAAPVQVSYLGYPGTLGLESMDYLIADAIVVPAKQREHYREKIIYLPHSYQVNDSTRSVAGRGYTREEVGLPSHDFVFSCFNQSYKITPGTFDLWMRILQRVDQSVLWLLEENATATENLRREARARGVDSHRLIFAGHLLLDQHLARHRLADLCIDTLPYNAHTTASDALWAGLPVLTLIGTSFAARVAASLLNAVGLPELVTVDPIEYEELAVALARNPARLREIRQRLDNALRTAPLFDTRQTTMHVEAAYAHIHAGYVAGKPLAHVWVHEDGRCTDHPRAGS